MARHIAYNKLVRDRIPEIIRAQGETPVTRTLTNEEFARGLARKQERGGFEKKIFRESVESFVK